MANEIATARTFDLALSEKLEGCKDALPADFNKARFVQNAMALLKDNENIRKYPPAMIMEGLMKAAYLGLDFSNKECYLVPYGNSLNYQTDYRGAKKLAKKYSIRPVKDIYAQLVREDDLFEIGIVDRETKLNFKPNPFSNKPIIGAFAVVIFEDGGMLYETMSKDDLETSRRQSKASNSPAWKNFPGEMYKKTVLHRLCKHIELDFSPAQRDAFMAGSEIETDDRELSRREIEEKANEVEFETV